MLESNDLRVVQKQNEIREMLISSIDALDARIKHVEQLIEMFIHDSNDATMVKALRLHKLYRDKGDDSALVKTAQLILVQRADEPGGELIALLASLSTRLGALNNKLEQHPEIIYVAPAPVERPPVVKAIPSPSEWAEQRLQKLGSEPLTEDQQSRFDAELKRIAAKDRVSLSRDLEDGDRQSGPSLK